MCAQQLVCAHFSFHDKIVFNEAVITFIGIIQFCTFLINAGLGVVIFGKNPRSRAHQAFALFAISSSGWILALYVAVFHLIDTLIAGRFTFFFGSLIGTGLLWFTMEFPEKPEQQQERLPPSRYIVFAMGTLLAALSLSPYMVYSAEVREGMYIFGTFNQIPYTLWVLFFLGSLIYSFTRAWMGVGRSRGIIRNQYIAFASGATIFLTSAVMTNILLPMLFNDFRWNSIGPVFTIFMIAFVAHAIISYRFLEIRWVIKRSFDFVFLWAFAFMVIFGFEMLLSRSFTLSTVNVLSSLVLAVIFVPFANYVSILTARVTSRGSYVFEDAVHSITELVHTSIGLEVLQQVIAEKLTEYFGFTKIALAAFTANHPEQPVKTFVRGFDRNVLKAITPGIRWCEQKNRVIVEANELQWKLNNKTDPENADCDRQVLAFLKEWDAAALIPFFVGTEMVGLALLGEKKDGSVLTQRDLALLNVLQGSAAPAMMNGVRYAEIKRLYTQLSTLDKAKSEFISVVSHQFRTPLTAILWNSELTLEDATLPSADKKSVEEIHQRASFLNVTLNRIFDLLALENKQLTFENKLVNLRDVVKAVEQEYHATCKAKNVGIVSTLEPAMVYGDHEKITSVVRTLIENACSFSRQRTKIGVKLTSIDGGKRTKLQVADRGIGVPEEEIPHIFDKFYRTGAAKLAAPDGAGISLYLAKQFVEKQRGNIDVASEEGKGSTFTVTFPMAEL